MLQRIGKCMLAGWQFTACQNFSSSVAIRHKILWRQLIWQRVKMSPQAGRNLLRRGCRKGDEAGTRCRKLLQKGGCKVLKREETRDTQFVETKHGIWDIWKVLKCKNSIAIIVEALRVTTDAPQKQKLQQKLVAMVLDLYLHLQMFLH